MQARRQWSHIFKLLNNLIHNSIPTENIPRKIKKEYLLDEQKLKRIVSIPTLPDVKRNSFRRNIIEFRNLDYTKK